MRKRIIAIFTAALLCVIAFSGCTSNENDNTTSSNLSNMASDAGESIKDGITNASNDMSNAASNVKDDITDMSNKADSDMSQAKETAKSEIDKMTSNME